ATVRSRMAAFVLRPDRSRRDAPTLGKQGGREPQGRSERPGVTAPLLGPAWRRLVLACAFPLLAAVVVGCDQAQQLGERVAPLGETPAPPEVPFGARLDEAGLLYTYVRADGSFAITEHASEIPEESRKQVRLVKEGHPPGTPSHVFVADLTGKAPGD